MEKIKIGLLGCGTVGSGVVKILNTNGENIKMRSGAEIAIEKILVRNVAKAESLNIPKELLTVNGEEIINNPEIKVIVEVMGGIEPAKTLILKAIANGKSIVTANKELIAKHGREILQAAEQHGVAVQFEASVGGGIPIIRPMKRCLAANDIEEIMGIINGTTNYILTKMTDAGEDFADVLKEAQEKGYAEADPTADVGGYDAAYKIAILSSIGFNSPISFDNVYFEGIDKISALDIEYANELNCVIKLLAIAKQSADGLEVRVHPTMISKKHPLASVKDVFNAIFVKGNAVGDVMFYGAGAGQMPTGSAVVADVIDIVRDIVHNIPGNTLNCTCFAQRNVKPIDDCVSSFYVRLECFNKPGVLSKISGVLGKHEVSIASMIQKGEKLGNEAAEIVWVTYEVVEKNLRSALKEILELEEVQKLNNVIRVEGVVK